MRYVYIDHAAWGIEQGSYWPEKGPINNSDIGFSWPDIEDAPWAVDMDAGGTLSTRWIDPEYGGMEPLNGTIPIYRTNDLEKLKRIFVLTCSRGYDTDPNRIVEEGIVWGFSWIPMTGTLWQLNAVQRILHMLMTDRPMDEVRAECDRLTAIVEEAAQLEMKLHGVPGA